MYKDTKPMKSAEEIIKDLEDKGIKFEMISKENAKIYLENNNNYFRLASYRKNFTKYEKGEDKGNMQT